MNDERSLAARAACEGRRALLCGAFGVAAAGMLPPALGASADDARKLPPQVGDELAHPSWEEPTGVVLASEVKLGGPPLLVYPREPQGGIARERSRLNQILIVRLAADTLDEATRARSAAGIVAYSGVCTHAACGVSEWDGATAHFICPCHASTFAARAGGKVGDGPATRGLPALPIMLVDDKLVVAGTFTAALGNVAP